MISNSAESIYRVVSYTLLILLLLYFFLSQIIILNEIGVGSSWQYLFTGPARLTLQHNVLNIKLKPKSKILELGLLEPLDECPVVQRNQPVKFHVKCSQGLDWITIEADNGQTLQNHVIALTNSNQSGPIRTRYIDIIRIDKVTQNIPYFYHDLIERPDSNVKLYYSFQLFNISAHLARWGGLLILYLVTGILLTLLCCQGLLILITVKWQPEVVRNYFENEQGRPLTLIDEASNRFAIPLGFLGTVVSVWYSLENLETDFTSFVRILDIMKVAVFSTVLGLLVKILCLIRGYFGTRK